MSRGTDQQTEETEKIETQINGKNKQRDRQTDRQTEMKNDLIY